MAEGLARMIGCPSCADFEATLMPCLYTATCIDCKARALAHGPLYFTSAASGKLDDAYRAALQRVFGADFKRGHQLVKSYAAKIKEQSTS